MRDFIYWPEEDRKKHLRNIFHALDVCAGRAMGLKITDTSVAVNVDLAYKAVNDAEIIVNTGVDHNIFVEQAAYDATKMASAFATKAIANTIEVVAKAASVATANSTDTLTAESEAFSAALLAAPAYGYAYGKGDMHDKFKKIISSDFDAIDEGKTTFDNDTRAPLEIPQKFP